MKASLSAAGGTHAMDVLHGRWRSVEVSHSAASDAASDHLCGSAVRHKSLVGSVLGLLVAGLDRCCSACRPREDGGKPIPC